ncbi:YcxB family protein [Streptomyces sp. S1D4-11]|nr:YcxB family protein [Streptomyces sp. S1D4-11]QIY99188.1 YcxB family protein [Streptomyces sp. S1D4-11]
MAGTTVGALLSAAGSGRHDTPWQLYAGVVVFAAFMTAVPWSRARRLHRLAQRQGDICGTVDDTGVRFTTAHSSASLDWHLYPRYAETPELFVLLSADKSAVGFVVLPKRAVADPEDVDRLRAVLDRRLVRADAAEAPGSPRSRGRGRAVGRGGLTPSDCCCWGCCCSSSPSPPSKPPRTRTAFPGSRTTPSAE